MAEIQQPAGNRKSGKPRAKKQSTRIDMTPMVDLAFLLLTFFVLTATFSQPKSMELAFPPNGEPSPIKRGITFLLSKNDRLFYYEGELKDEAVQNNPKTKLSELSFSQREELGLHKFLLKRNKNLHEEIKSLDRKHKNKQVDDETFKRLVRAAKSDKESYTFLIKTDDNATYKNVIDVIDELNINVVGKYAVTEMIAPEQELLNAAVSFAGNSH